MAKISTTINKYQTNNNNNNNNNNNINNNSDIDTSKWISGNFSRINDRKIQIQIARRNKGELQVEEQQPLAFIFLESSLNSLQIQEQPVVNTTPSYDSSVAQKRIIHFYQGYRLRASRKVHSSLPASDEGFPTVAALAIVDNRINDDISTNMYDPPIYAYVSTTTVTTISAISNTTPEYTKDLPYTTSSPLSNDVYNKTLLAAERERIRAEFFATYDVMTGIRIAATLGAFFGLMVFLIVWKSRSSSNETMKVLKDPKMAAVAAVCMQEEEEREIQEAMVATGMSIYPDEYDTILYRRQRLMSLGNVSAPPMLNRSFRFSSVGGGGYSSLLEPPRRFSFTSASRVPSIGGFSYQESRCRSGSEASRIFSNYPMGSSFGTDDYFMETDDDGENNSFKEDNEDNTGDVEELNDRTDRIDRTRIKNGDSQRDRLSNAEMNEQKLIQDPFRMYSKQQTFQQAPASVSIYTDPKEQQGFLELPSEMSQDLRRDSAMTCCSTNSSYLERRTSAFTLGMKNLPPSLQRKPSSVSHASSTDNWDYYYPDIQVIEPTPSTSPQPTEGVSFNNKQISTTAITSAKTEKVIELLDNGHGNRAVAIDIPEEGRTTYDLPVKIKDMEKEALRQRKPDQSSGTMVFPVGVHQSSVFRESMKDRIRSKALRRKQVVVERPALLSQSEQTTTSPSLISSSCDNNNSQSMSLNTVASQLVATTSSSISMDSTPLSIDKLNGGGSHSLGTVSAKALFNANRRAPLASLSSFKISSLEYPDSELYSPNDDSVFLEHAAGDTDEDLQQLSSDSDETSPKEANNLELDLFAEKDECLVPTVVTILPSESRPQARAHPSTLEKSYTTSHSTHVFVNMLDSGEDQTAMTRSRRSLLQRHRTINTSSPPRDASIMPSTSTIQSQPLKDFSSSALTSANLPPTGDSLETQFGAVVQTKYGSENQTALAAIEEVAVPLRSSSFIELPCGSPSVLSLAPDSYATTLGGSTAGGSNETGPLRSGSGDRPSTSISTQRTSLMTVVSFDRVSPQLDESDRSRSQVMMVSPTSRHDDEMDMLQQLQRQQLPTITTTLQLDDNVALSVSDIQPPSTSSESPPAINTNIGLTTSTASHSTAPQEASGHDGGNNRQSDESQWSKETLF